MYSIPLRQQVSTHHSRPISTFTHPCDRQKAISVLLGELFYGIYLDFEKKAVFYLRKGLANDISLVVPDTNIVDHYTRESLYNAANRESVAWLVMS